MAAHRFTEVVVVERVRGDAVEEGGIQGAGLARGAEHRTRPRYLGNAGQIAGDRCSRLYGPGQRHAERVDDSRPC